MNSQIENIHIIFTEFVRTTLTSNEELDIKTSNIISLEDDLRIGPISNLKSTTELEDRKDWLSNVLKQSIRSDQITSKVEKDIDKINTILSAEKQTNLFLWSGNNARDILSASRLITKVKNLNIPIFMANFSEITLQTRNGRFFSPQNLVEVNSSQVNKIFRQFQQIDTEQIIKWERLWKKLVGTNSLLRILDGNGGINFKRETHFDNLLESFCSNEFQESAKIVGKTLVETKFAISDWFLNWRLIKMSEMKKIETIGELKDMKDFKVRISTNNAGI